MAKELDTNARALLTRTVNRVALKQAVKANIERDIKEGKALIRQLMTQARLDRHETARAAAVLSWPERREFDVALIAKIVDEEDLDVVAPRSVKAAKLDEVIGHHKYDGLDKAISTKRAKTPTLEVRQIEG